MNISLPSDNFRFSVLLFSSGIYFLLTDLSTLVRNFSSIYTLRTFVMPHLLDITMKRENKCICHIFWNSKT
jgi:hypothetical protein